MDRDKALHLANQWVKECACPLHKGEYVGELYGNMIFHCPCVNKGKYLGWPIYISVSNNGHVNKLNPPQSFEAIKLRNKTNDNGNNI